MLKVRIFSGYEKAVKPGFSGLLGSYVLEHGTLRWEVYAGIRSTRSRSSMAAG